VRVPRPPRERANAAGQTSSRIPVRRGPAHPAAAVPMSHRPSKFPPHRPAVRNPSTDQTGLEKPAQEEEGLWAATTRTLPSLTNTLA
jgi:hypothetical protein